MNGLAAGFNVNFFGAALSDAALSLPDDAFGVCYTDQTKDVIGFIGTNVGRDMVEAAGQKLPESMWPVVCYSWRCWN